MILEKAHCMIGYLLNPGAAQIFSKTSLWLSDTNIIRIETLLSQSYDNITL